MNARPEVAVGQIYQDRDKRMNCRRVTVLSVFLQKKTKGRLKARYTYADCITEGLKSVLLDVDNLRSSRWSLVFSPCPVTKEGTQDACPVPPSGSENAMVPPWL